MRRRPTDDLPEPQDPPEPPLPPPPPSAGLTIVGTNGDDYLEGTAGADIIHGLGGIDAIYADAGDDQLFGGAGDDLLNGGTGADMLDGGAGEDTIRYKASSAGVFVNLAAGVGSNGEAQGDTYVGIEHVLGSNFDDLIIGNSANNNLRGYDGNDLLFGGGGQDSLRGMTGVDQLYGGEGDDVLDGGEGADVLDGGAGEDTVTYIGSLSSWGVVVDLALGTGFSGDAQGDTYVSIEHVIGSNFHDMLAGDAGNNQLRGENGNDTIYGRAGNDMLFAGDGNDILDGGVGADKLDGGIGEDTVSYLAASAGVTLNLNTGVGTGGEAAGDTFVGIEHVDGSAFADTLAGNAANNYLYGAAGNDVLAGGAGNDQLIGGEGHDVLRGGAGADFLDGSEGVDGAYYQDSTTRIYVDLTDNLGYYGDAEGDTYYGIENIVGTAYGDSLTGNAGSNDLVGLGGDDWLDGRAGNDRLIGGEGDDSLYGGLGADKLDGGNGNDWIFYGFSTAGVTVNLVTGVGSGGEAQGDTFFGIENVNGSNFSDFLIGNAGNNILYGGNGNDTIMGGAGQDQLWAGDGHDILTGDSSGIVAADTFVLSPGYGSATITDFQQGVDKIDLGGHTPPNFGTDGQLAWGYIDQNGLHANSLDASDGYFFDTSTHTLYQCEFSNGTLVLHDAVVTINADVPKLETSDFLLM